MSGLSQKPSFSRRHFLAASAVVLGASAAGPLFLACSTAPAPAPTTAPAAPPAQAPATSAPASLPATATPATSAQPTPAAAQPTAAAKPTTAAPVPAATAAPTAAAAAGAEKSDFGVAYPADAATKDKQYTLTASSSSGVGWKCMDFNEAVYARAPLADLFTEPLVRLTKDFEIVPGQANKWEVSKDGLAWTFYLDKGLMWSDGNEVSADDYIATFRYNSDPKHAWDFTWYWSGIIKNYEAVTKGQMPPAQVGVHAGADKYQVVFETEQPTPFLPAMLLYSWPLSKAGLDKAGSGVYNTNPSTCVSSGPFVLEEWSPDRRFVVKANPKYTGKLRPMVNRMVANVVSGGSDMARYQAGEVDTIVFSSPADIKLVLGDANLKAQMKVNPQDFRTFYLFFDVTSKPWDNVKVRQAFAKAVDRESIVKGILAPLAVPAYSFLMPGFPDSNAEALKPLQVFDPAAAKSLLAEAGFPNGQGFPKATLFVRGGGPATDASVTQAVAASIKQTLNVQVDLQTKDQPAFMSDLNAKPTKIPFGWISYGMDYFDATNMLGVWLSNGRHNWNNADFDKLVKDGGKITDDPKKRTDMMQQAEKLLVTDTPGIFVYHQLVGQLYKPYRKGDYLAANKYGYDGAQWNSEQTAGLGFNTMYIGKEVTNLRKG